MAISEKKPSNVIERNHLDASDLFEPQCSLRSSSVTCGMPFERAEILFLVLADAVRNRLPAVILYNGDENENILRRIEGIFQIGENKKFYDPFFGMTKDQVLSHISSFKKDAEETEMRALKEYLSLLFDNYGATGVSLRDLFWLLSCKETELQDYILNSQLTAGKKTEYLSTFEAYYDTPPSGGFSEVQKVLNMIEPIITAYSNGVWSEDVENNGISILNVVSHGGIIAVRVRETSNQLLSLLADEISRVEKRFLLACCDLNVESGSLLYKTLKNHAQVNAKPLFVSSSDIASMTSESEAQNTAWSALTGDIFAVLSCDNEIMAEPYTKFAGDFLKRNETTHQHTERHFFHLFPDGVGKGVAVTDIIFPKVMKDKFCRNGGCVAFMYKNIIVARKFNVPQYNIVSN